MSGPAWLEMAVGGPVSGALTISALADEGKLGRSGFALTSPAFRHNDELDPSFTASEEDAVAPPLEWSAPPPGSQELALVVEDAETGRVHWLAWGFPPQRGKLLEGEAPPRAGKNALGNSEWLLPDPPVGEEHCYVFQLFALDLPLTLMPGANHGDLVKVVRDHVVAVAILAARFTAREAEDWDGGDIEG